MIKRPHSVGRLLVHESECQQHGSKTTLMTKSDIFTNQPIKPLTGLSIDNVQRTNHVEPPTDSSSADSDDELILILSDRHFPTHNRRSLDGKSNAHKRSYDSRSSSMNSRWKFESVDNFISLKTRLQCSWNVWYIPELNRPEAERLLKRAKPGVSFLVCILFLNSFLPNSHH